jgi:hypothetical protein
MRQCHMNLTLANQQSDSTKTLELHDEMQRLNQQQAKLHFSMDELLSKERKLDSASSAKLSSIKPSTMSVSNFVSNPINNISYGDNNNMMEIKSEHLPSSPQVLTIDSPQCTMIQSQNSSLSHSHLAHRNVLSHEGEITLSPQGQCLSPQNLQIRVDDNEQIFINDSGSFDNNIRQFPNNGPTMLQENIGYVNM